MRPTRRGGRRATALAAAVGLALIASFIAVACAPVAADDPIGGAQRQRMRASILDSGWRQVLQQFPDAIRPTIGAITPVSGEDRSAALIGCLRASGIRATATDNGFRYSSSLGQSQLEYALVSYTCSARFPSDAEVMSYLTPAQRDALFYYEAVQVHGCLLRIGARSPAPPPDRATVAYPASREWDAYSAVRASDPSPATIAFLEARCPPLPVWLSL